MDQIWMKPLSGAEDEQLRQNNSWHRKIEQACDALKVFMGKDWQQKLFANGDPEVGFTKEAEAAIESIAQACIACIQNDTRTESHWEETVFSHTR